ncbi:MAG: DUF445 family protein [Syntrophomonadaceae bacterium]|mgnify:CR=1 FL=1|nr:DUF445 family protein [Syntrophomonadaceae bacterium]
MQLLAIPLIGAFIGYITNVFAIKMLFWPRQPVKLVFFELQGLLPKRHREIASSIGELIEEQLLSIDDLIDYVDTPELRQRIVTEIVQVLKQRLSKTILRITPNKLYGLIEDSLEKVVRQEADHIIRQAIKSSRETVTSRTSVKQLVEDRINAFELNELEVMIRQVSHTELRFIEILGGVLGFLLGLIQVTIILLFPN